MPEVIDAAIARTEQVDATLGAVAHAAYDRARAEARDPRPGCFAGVPTFVKDNVDVRGMPTQHGTDAFRARAGAGRRRLRPDVPRHRPGPARQDPALGVRVLRRRRPRAPGAGAQPVAHRPLRRRLVGRVRRAGRRGCRADRARQRRRRLDPHPRRGQRARRAQADPRAAGPGQDDARDARAHRLRRRADPQRARHRGVLPRGGEGLAQPAPRPHRRHHPPGQGATAHRRRHPGHRPRLQPRGPRADPAHRGAARAAGPPRRGDRQPRARQLPRPLRPVLVDARAA